MIEYADEDSEYNETEHGSNYSQETNDPKVLKEVWFPEVVSCGEDDGRKNEREEYLVGELDVLVNDEGKYRPDRGSKSDGYYWLMQVGDLLDGREMRCEDVADQNADHHERL